MMLGFKKIVVPQEPELVATVAPAPETLVGDYLSRVALNRKQNEGVTGDLCAECGGYYQHEPECSLSGVCDPALLSAQKILSVTPHAHLPELTSQFLLAGKAIFTVSNPKKEHYTFKVRRVDSEWPQGSGKMSTTYFVSVKAEGGTYPYRYIGLLQQSDIKGTIKCTAKSEFVPGTKEYDVASWATMSVLGSKLIPAGYHIEHAGRCGRCGLTLTDPESIERGIGPECWTTMKTDLRNVPGAWGMFDARWMAGGPGKSAVLAARKKK